MQNFIYPIINGFFETKPLQEYSKNLSIYLIARKDCRRSGMRFLIRGSDNIGNVTNYIETEQILIMKNFYKKKNYIYSYIQIRGSIPMKWTQEPNLQLNPKILINKDNELNKNVFKNHIMN